LVEVLHPPIIHTIRKELPARTGDIFPVNKSISVEERVGGEVLEKEI